MAAVLSVVPEFRAAGEGLVCALTVDDGPNGADTARLLDALHERDIRAVFAVVGQQVAAEGGAALVRRIVNEGHVVCNHSMSFADMGEWGAEQVRADLAATSALVREALGDPHAAIPFFRAPNGNWGNTAAVAVELGMQPLAVVNVIEDWIDQDPDVRAGRLRSAMVPGELVLVHDGGGSRAGTVEAVIRVIDERLAEGWAFTLPVGATSDGWAAGGLGGRG